jgi:hypothetical protein
MPVKKKLLKQEDESYVYSNYALFGGRDPPILVQTEMLQLTAVYIT